eukprot:c18828_g1_i1 orf=531-1838(+)
MERWRSFFSKTGEDLWTIIEQAIVLAANDYPEEFKEKRCDIAEMLFARRPHLGDPDVTRLSASVVTNCTNRMDVDELRDDEHVSIHKKEQAGHNGERDHIEFCSVEACDDGADDHASISTVVCNIKETLDDTMQSDEAVLHGLQRLESLHISVDVLKATEIGKQVNNLRKHTCKEIRLLAKGLVRQWKELVDDWVNRAKTSNGPSGEGLATSKRDIEEEGMFLISADKGVHFTTQQPSGNPQHCYYDMKPRDSYLEAPEERGSSSRAELSGLGRNERLEKSQFDSRDAVGKEVVEDESNVVTDRLLGMKGSNGSLGPGRPSMDVVAGKGTGLSRSCGFGKPSTEGSNVSSQKQKQSRLPTISQPRFTYNEGVRLEEKSEASKRKSQEGYSQVENAKKQQTAHPMNFKDVCQGRLIQAKTAFPGLAPQSSHWYQAR